MATLRGFTMRHGGRSGDMQKCVRRFDAAEIPVFVSGETLYM